MSKIDVSKCAFYYDNGKCNNPNGTSCNCINVAYCYYKQLQQLKQENATLNSRLEKIKEYCIKPTNKYETREETKQELLIAKDYELTNKGLIKRDILQIIEEE